MTKLSGSSNGVLSILIGRILDGLTTWVAECVTLIMQSSTSMPVFLINVAGLTLRTTPNGEGRINEHRGGGWKRGSHEKKEGRGKLMQARKKITSISYKSNGTEIRGDAS